MKLYSYWRSSAAYRIRIVLNLKKLGYDTVPISLIGATPAHRSESYQQINPQQLVPFLQDGSVGLGQSQAIFEYLEETYPEIPLLPDTPSDRGIVRSFCNLICCDIHPLNNLRVMTFLKNELLATPEQVGAWYAHWIVEGFESAEKFALANSSDGKFVFGNKPTFADACLVPQIYNAKRFDISLSQFPTLVGIASHCNLLAEFQAAAPEEQPDALLG